MALMVLDEARAGGVEDGGTSKANVFAYTAAISACGKAGQWEKAVSLLDVRKREEKRGEMCCKQIMFELAVIVYSISVTVIHAEGFEERLCSSLYL